MKGILGKLRQQDFPGILILILLTAAVSVGTFVGGLWAILGIVGAPLLFVLVWIKTKQPPAITKNFLILAVAALAAMAVLNLVSEWPEESWREWLRLASVFLALSLFPTLKTNALQQALPFLIALAIISVLSLAVELFFGGTILHMVKTAAAPLTEYNRGISYMVILSFAVLAAVQYGTQGQPRWNAATIGLILALFIATGLTESRAAKMSLLAGLVIVVFGTYRPRQVFIVLAALPAMLCLWPFVIQTLFISCHDLLRHLPDSWLARVEIWNYMSYRILEHPWLGWGLGTSHLLPITTPHPEQNVFIHTAAGHPHNAIVQLWVELGVPGLALGLAFAWLTLAQAARLEERLRPYAFGAWMAGLSLSLVAFNYWSDSLFACFALTGFTFSLLGGSAMRKRSDS